MIELLVAISLASIVSLAIYKIFDIQTRLFSGENKVVDMQGLARNSINLLARNIRLAGLDPREVGVNRFGITDSSFSTGGSAVITSSDAIYFTTDLNESGALDVNEFMAFKLEGFELKRAVITDTSGTIGSWHPVAGNVTSLNIVYGYADRTDSDTSGLPDNSVSLRNFKDIRSVTITLTARTDNIHDLTRQTVHETVTTLVKLRNNTGI